MLSNYLKLLRPQHWYKNLVVFLALFFSGSIFQIDLLLTTTLAFISLCLVSSTNYIINDLKDIENDRINPEKKHRPLAQSIISKTTAILLAIIILIAGLSLAFYLNLNFFFLVISLFLLTQLYTFVLKRVVIADVLTISTLFVIRAVSGSLAINVIISPWLVLCPFFLSLFLSVGKRQAEAEYLKTKAAATRDVLRYYTNPFTNSLMILSTALLVISYTFYSFLSPYNFLLYSLPFALYLIFRFYYLITSGSTIPPHPEKMIYDKALVIGIIIWLCVTTALIY